MMSIKKVSLLMLLASAVCGSSVFAMETDNFQKKSPSIQIDTSLNTDDDPKKSQQIQTNTSSSTNDDLKKELERMTLVAKIAELKKKAEQDDLEALKVNAEKDRLTQAKKEEKKVTTSAPKTTTPLASLAQKKQTGLAALANTPRPLSRTSTVDVVQHNIKVEAARGAQRLGNFLKGKGWTRK